MIKIGLLITLFAIQLGHASSATSFDYHDIKIKLAQLWTKDQIARQEVQHLMDRDSAAQAFRKLNRIDRENWQSFGVLSKYYVDHFRRALGLNALITKQN